MAPSQLPQVAPRTISATAMLVGSATVSGYPTAYTVAWEPGNGVTDDEPQPYFGIFAQDSSGRFKKNLTVNYGIRYDFDTGNSHIKTLPGLNRIQ